MSTVEGCNKLAEEIMKREPKLDILVNNAGAAWGANFDEFPEAGWDKVMNLNVKSLFFLTKALAKPLRAAATAEKPGKVINIASIDGLSVNPLETYSYQASKAAVIHLTRRMAAKLIKDNINVTAICPGAFQSDMNTAARDHGDSVAKAIPSKRIGAPKTWPALPSISLRARATTWSATRSPSTAASSTPISACRWRGSKSDHSERSLIIARHGRA
jgi:NAD(P)-dependent dehydrogenase (short-subunit alcohol dehydrogenase family)